MKEIIGIEPRRLFEIIVCIALAWWVYPLFTGLMLQEAIYARPSYLQTAFMQPLLAGVTIATLVLLLLDRIPGTYFYNAISWQSMEQGRALRLLIGLSSLILAWKFSNHGYNFYLDQPHILERMMLWVLWGLLILHPVFAPVFFGFTMIIINQMRIPINVIQYTLTDKSLLLAIMMMFCVWLVVRFFTRSRTSTLIYLFLCVIGAHYFVPGQEKLSLGAQPWDWLLYNRLDNLFVSSYTHGWLAFLGEETILQLAGIVRMLNVPLGFITLLTELGVIFIVFNRRVTIVMLMAAVALHIGIVLASGIFFWKWIVFEVLLIIFLATRDESWIETLYTRQLFALSTVIILFSNMLFHVVALGWFDSKISHVYQFEVETTEGEIYAIDSSVMQPFDIMFAQNRFFILMVIRS